MTESKSVVVWGGPVVEVWEGGITEGYEKNSEGDRYVHYLDVG